MLKEGIIIGERYEIISRVGSGGMADVYKAMDHKLNRLVAVKVLKAEFRGDGSFIAKFRKEAQAAAGLSHPNIVNVYDVGEDRGLYYIVMELVEGITLKSYIDKKGKLSVKEATSIAIQVSLGLQSAHNQGIVHRDVKPQNIIISKDGKVKLSDFGIAKAINSNTITANVMGSVHFSSPEQVRGGVADAKSDIYSLGITMYEMVTGRVPFDGDTTVAIAIKHLQEEIIPPSRYTPDLPYSLEQIILKCTQKNPERRYANIGLLIEDLKRSLVDPQGNFVQMVPVGATSSVLPNPETVRAAEANKTQASKVQNTRYMGIDEDELEDDYDDEDDTDYSGYSDDYDDYEEDESPKRKKKKRKKRDSDEVSSKLEKAITIGGFAIGAVIIIILIIVIGNMSGLFNNNSNPVINSSSQTSEESSSTNDSIEVPDLRGYTVEQAQSIAAQFGFEIAEGGTGESSEYAEGEIMSQDPAEHTTIEGGDAANMTITVIVSSGPSSVTIPTGIVGSTQAEAETTLGNLNLIVSVNPQSSDTVETGHVISVDPTEGSAVAPGSTVTINVSTGPENQQGTEETFELPNVASYDEASAIRLLDQYGLGYTTQTVETEDSAAGTVLYTNPAAGTTVSKGDMITIYVAVAPGEEQPGNPENPETVPTDDEYWVCNEGFAEPRGYNGGACRLELVQNGTSTVIYEGENPFGDDYTYNDPVQGTAGVSTGTVNVYEYNRETGQYDILAGSVELTFTSPSQQ